MIRRTAVFLLVLALIGAHAGMASSASAASAAQSAGAAKPPGKTAAQAKTSSGASQKTLAALTAEFDALCGDVKKGGLRDSWLRLADKAKTLSAKSTGGIAAGAAFYYARTFEELGRRSYRKDDRKSAADAFAAVTKQYPDSSHAAESMYRRANILGRYLDDAEQAGTLLRQLKKQYPRSQSARDADALAARLSGKGGSESRATPSGTGDAGRTGGAGDAGRTGGAGDAGGRAAQKPASVELMEQLGLTVKTIMIDAGHGGKDPGCTGNGIVEKDFTLRMAKRLGGMLEKKGFTVLYTRSSDTFISLQGRPEIADTKNADLFISLHVNAAQETSLNGLETYYLDAAENNAAATVAARENAVSVSEISDLQFILTDLMLSSKVKESRALAGCVHNGILGSLRKAGIRAVDHGVRSAPFYVLMGARMPAVLVEFGYASNKGDAANLKSDAFLQKQAEGLVDGVVAYKALLTKKAP